MIATVFACISMLLAGIAFAGYAVVLEQGRTIESLTRDRDLARDESKSLMEALGRAGKTPIQFDRQRKPLEKLDTYYEQRPQVTKITAG